ncbi:FAD-binding protein [Dyadobacter sp. NIV53]|uniref:FAD-binding protein n=1 Tax=Dyadobacter sp. NIV53 TaxID=2861765 RepID=UPI001C87007E|nr:FAD-binding protein [Dyadobacter sp. NIV53]
MIRRNGQKNWSNIHVTIKQTVDDLIDIDNSNATGSEPDKYEILNQASKDINELIKEAKLKNKRIRAIGSAWALTNIQATDNWLINTKLLNKCFENDDSNFHDNYPPDKRKLLVIAQCGVSIGELNVYLERPKNASQIARSLKTAGIGAGQTVVGAVSGNTHGAAVNFGALPEFVVAIQLCNGTDKPVWIERSKYPVMNQSFIDKIGSKLIRNDDIFNSALVSFGAFGIVTAYAIETEPIYHINFPKIKEVNQTKLGALLNDPGYYSKLQHLEFVFNPYEENFYLIEGTRVPFEEGHPFPEPLWIVTNKFGYAPGDKTTKFLLNLPFISGKRKSKILFKQYLKNAVLSEVRGSSGQLYTATITYLEGYNETAFAVSISDAVITIEVIKQAIEEMSLPLVFQARTVHPGATIFGFTNHLPRAVVFEYGIVNTSKYPKFEELLLNKLRESDVKFTLHWSKNSLVDPARLEEMYGQAKINIWKKSRYTLFENDVDLISIFNNIHLSQAGLDTPPDVLV